jgi:hypothetical protein
VVTSDDFAWPTATLTALRLGRRLVAETPATRPGRRAFVDIRPVRDAADITADSEGWIRSSSTRSFRLDHWEYDEQHLDSFDYDIGAEHIRTTQATDETHLLDVLRAWRLDPVTFGHPWKTDDPR